jgi:hypothetical protein
MTVLENVSEKITTFSKPIAGLTLDQFLNLMMKLFFAVAECKFFRENTKMQN